MTALIMSRKVANINCKWDKENFEVLTYLIQIQMYNGLYFPVDINLGRNETWSNNKFKI